MIFGCNVCDSKMGLLERGQGLAEVQKTRTGKASRVKMLNTYYILKINVMKLIPFYNDYTLVHM